MRSLLMPFIKKKTIFVVMLFLFSCTFQKVESKKTRENSPQITIVIILDQFAYHYINKLKMHFRYGLKFLLENGIFYNNAHHPHGVPETSPGHLAFNTGVTPKDHSISVNNWIAQDGVKVNYDDDNSTESAVLNSQAPSTQGKSPHRIKVDGLSDQFCMLSRKSTCCKVFSLSLKSRSAIALASRIGKAVWFDDHTGLFTSSKKYFEQLPAWVTAFNSKKKINELKQIAWNTSYPENHPAYDFPFIKNYDYAERKGIACKQDIPIDHTQKSPYELYLKTPHASLLLFELAKECLKHNFRKRAQNKIMLWISPSNLDLAGHIYGPDSLEAIDLVYHLDKQVQDFMLFVQRSFGSKNVLFVLSADHGIQPMQEISYKKGFTSAKRIMATPLIQAMNKLIAEKYECENVVLDFESTSFKLDEKKLHKLDAGTREYIIRDLKSYLLNVPGIKKVWTPEELHQSTFAPDDLENFYKNSLYQDRLGDLICMPDPYCIITTFKTGCSHVTPYDYDTHVPLFIYQKGRFGPKTIHQKVWIPQVPITLSNILRIPHPTASTFTVLPGIFD